MALDGSEIFRACLNRRSDWLRFFSLLCLSMCYLENGAQRLREGWMSAKLADAHVDCLAATAADVSHYGQRAERLGRQGRA
jgi:hypothetical protein